MIPNNNTSSTPNNKTLSKNSTTNLSTIQSSYSNTKDIQNEIKSSIQNIHNIKLKIINILIHNNKLSNDIAEYKLRLKENVILYKSLIQEKEFIDEQIVDLKKDIIILDENKNVILTQSRLIKSNTISSISNINSIGDNEKSNKLEYQKLNIFDLENEKDKTKRINKEYESLNFILDDYKKEYDMIIDKNKRLNNKVISVKRNHGIV